MDYFDFLQFMAEPEIEEPSVEDFEVCVECGTVVVEGHYSCQGHQFCLPECPNCGGGLISPRCTVEQIREALAGN